MYDLATLRLMNAEAGKEAEEAGKTLLVFTNTAEIDSKDFAFPLLGDYVPKGWELLDEPAPLFCDTSGWGQPDEPALTMDQLLQRLKELFTEDPDYGYGVIEAGQFQAHVGVFKRVATD